MAKLTEVKEEKKTKKGAKLDLGKVKKLIDDNPEAVRKIKEGVTEIITKKVVKKATGKSTKKKTSSKSSGTDFSKVLDLAGTFLNKK